MTDNDNQNAARIPDDILMAYISEKAFNTEGVYRMGSYMSAAAIRKNILGQNNKTRGVRVTYNEENGYTIDIYLIALFGSNIPETAWNVQKSVYNGLKSDYGVEAEGINIHVQGVHAD